MRGCDVLSLTYRYGVAQVAHGQSYRGGAILTVEIGRLAGNRNGGCPRRGGQKAFGGVGSGVASFLMLSWLPERVYRAGIPRTHLP